MAQVPAPEKKSSRICLVVAELGSEKGLRETLSSIKEQSQLPQSVFVIDQADARPEVRELARTACAQEGWSLVSARSPLEAIEKSIALIEPKTVDTSRIWIPLWQETSFTSPYILEIMEDIYRKGELWMTYGRIVDRSTGQRLGLSKFRRWALKLRFTRLLKGGFPYFFSFQEALFRKIDPAHFKDRSGNYWTGEWDRALFYPLIEMARKNVKYLNNVMLIADKERLPQSNIKSIKQIRRLKRYRKLSAL